MPDLEKSQLKIGFVRLTDCVVLAAAKERGEFEAEGLNVEMLRFESWAAIRDQLAYGELDAAHLLSPMVVASAAGLGPFPGRLTTSFVLNLNGNAITVSTALLEQMRMADLEQESSMPLSANSLANVVSRRRREGAPALTFAVVYPFSMHNYELRYWLAAGRIHPDHDVRIVVASPSRMVDLLRSGAVDGYCVGEPWNSEAIRDGVGRTLITSGEIWANRPEKVLGVRADWAATHPNTHRAIIRALLRAARWTDMPGNRIEAATIIAKPDYVDLPAERIEGALTGKDRQTAGDRIADFPDFNVFHRYAANFPWRSHAAWIAAQMVRWGQAPTGIDVLATARAAFEPASFRLAAAECGVPAPLIDFKTEGARAQPWLLEEATSPISMGADMLLDGRSFDCSDPASYISGFVMHSMRLARERQEV